MIDCENEVFTRVADGLRDAFPDVNVTSEYVRAPTSFPHVSVVRECFLRSTRTPTRRPGGRRSVSTLSILRAIY